MTGSVVQGLESSLHKAVVGFCNRPRVGDNQRISAAVCSVFVVLLNIWYINNIVSLRNSTISST